MIIIKYSVISPKANVKNILRKIMQLKNKDPGPEGPALVSPWKGVVYIAIFLLEYWSVGVVEYCKCKEQKPSGYIVILEDTVFS
jgi:hypothetical protein